MATEAASSSSSLSDSFTYQVFLSFRGEDTRDHFTSDLYSALDKEGINTFMDPKLPKGEEISAELSKAIKESEVSIIVFSENYANSRWCLDELVEILQCKASNQQQVRPIFYKVNPKDVRHQIGLFGEAFRALDQHGRYKDSMTKWRKALKEAANLSGWHFSDDKSEYQFISKIVKELSDNILIPSNNLEVAKFPIGIDSHRQHVENLIDMENKSVRMIGIWGPGGVGKSTIAKAVFNSIKRNFEGSCFLADVRSNSIQHGGLAKLQETLLSDILRDSNLRVGSVDKGVSLIKTRMQRKRVLLVLDDVSELKHLENLAPSIDCFGPGSRILITTRDQRWLDTHDVNLVYEVEMMDDVQASELFSQHAFECSGPPNDYLQLTQRAVRYAGGLPLALIVLGSHMFRRSKEEWEAILDSSKGDHRTDIQKVLKISYDALGDDLKEFFLDIACFFKGISVDNVKSILEACHEDLKAVIGLKQLQEKSLIRIDRVDDGYEVLWMHDLIEEMGKDIGKSSRLWNWDDLDRALRDNIGTEKLKGIHNRWNRWSPFNDQSPMFLNAKSFSKMVNLKYISVRDRLKQFSKGNIDYLSNELKWVDWYKCPFHSFPTNFSPRKLVRFDISYSPITRLWEGRENLLALKYFELRGCGSLVELPDFTGTPNLETLILSSCSSLVEMHHSVGALHKLVTLRVTHCSEVTALPKFSGKMSSLRELTLSWNGIERLDSSIGNLIGLQKLTVKGLNNTTMLPCSIYGLQNLRNLSLLNCSIAYLTNSKNLLDDNGGGTLSLPSLETLDIERCNLSECDFLETLDCLDTLTYLKLSGNNIVSLPECISKFLKLEKLDLSGCWRLREVPELPPNLVEVDAICCDSLERIWNLSETLERKQIRRISLWNCCNLGFDLVSLEGLLLNKQANSQFVFVFPGTITAEDAKWLHCWKTVNVTRDVQDVLLRSLKIWPRCSITISKNLKWENLGLAVIAESVEGLIFNCETKILINGVRIRVDNLRSDSRGSSDHVWVSYIPLSVEMKTRVDNQKDYSSLPHYECEVEFLTVAILRPLKSIGVHLVCKESKDDENSAPRVIEEPSQQKRPLRGDDDASDFPELSDPPQPKWHRRTKSV